jgi:predicted permease
MHSILQDIRYAARQLVRSRTTSIIAILTLALGIGANTSVFSLVNALLFKPAAASDPTRLVWLAPKTPHTRRFTQWSYPNYKDVRDRATSYDGVIAFSTVELSLGGEAPERIRGIVASGNYFAVLGTRVALGRGLTPDDDGAPGAHPVAVLSYNSWTRRFGADTAAVGRPITLNGKPYTIVGVAAKGFNGAEIGEGNDLWSPIAQLPYLSAWGTDLLTNRNTDFFRVIARLKADASIARASNEATSLAAQLIPAGASPDDALSITVLPLIGGLDPSNRSEIAPILGLVMIVPLLVLLVACANVANLFIGRALARRKELAVRRAIGASRHRLVRLLLTESVLLALAAGAAGVVLSSWMTAIISRVADIPLDIAPALVPDGRVFAATAILAVACGVFFGLVPALAATSTSLTPALKNEGITIGRSRHRLRNAFVVAQASASLVLMISAGLLVRSLGKALDVAPGFDAHNAVAMSFDASAQGYSRDAQETFRRRLLADVRGLPGIESAALVNVLPLSSRRSATQVIREGAASDDEQVTVRNAAVTDGYFETMRVPLARGRAFASTDVRTGPPVAIVNETLARRLWPGQDAIGKRLRVPGKDQPLREVVGVARDGKYENLTEAPTNFYFVPAAQDDIGSDVTLVARTSGGDPSTGIQRLTKVFRSLDPNMPVFRVTTLEANIRGTVDGQRAGAALLGVFGVLALALTALGIYGVVAHGVTLRTREIGIRMSLGAQTSTVLAQFVREGLVLTFIGVAIGVVVSAALSRVLAQFLFGLTATDLVTFALGSGVLCVAAFVASIFPARRAAKVDPMVALRSE